MAFYWSESLSTPVGIVTVYVNEVAVVGLQWGRARIRLDGLNRAPGDEPTPRVLRRAVKELREYFSGKRRDFTVSVQLQGTDFQKAAWRQLMAIPYGSTISYEEQAVRLGSRNYLRAVGGANGKNPISVMVPCHRVIGKDGSLTGFAAGLKVKKYLLELERAI